MPNNKKIAIDEAMYERAKFFERCVDEFKRTLKTNDKIYVEGERYFIIHKYSRFATVQGKNYQTSFFYDELYRGRRIGQYRLCGFDSYFYTDGSVQSLEGKRMNQEYIDKLIDKWGWGLVSIWCEMTAYIEQDDDKKKIYLEKAKELQDKQSEIIKNTFTIADYYGLDKQCNQTIEECGELI